MPKNPNTKKAKPVKESDPMNGAIKFFLAGCVAELYLLIVRRFYINGTLEQVVAWDSYLKVFTGIGLAILAVGLVLALLGKANHKKKVIGWCVSAVGAFLGLSSFLIQRNLSVLTLLTVVVPVVMLLGIIWCLYDPECALSLTILGLSLVALWVFRRAASSMYLGIYVKAAVAVYVLLLAAVAFLVKRGKLSKLLSAPADTLPVYVACGLSAAALLVALVAAPAAYYAMWVLAVVVFALAVYYTVKQL